MSSYLIVLGSCLLRGEPQKSNLNQLGAARTRPFSAQCRLRHTNFLGDRQNVPQGSRCWECTGATVDHYPQPPMGITGTYRALKMSLYNELTLMYPAGGVPD